MATIQMSKSTAVRVKLNHPVIDSDAHTKGTVVENAVASLRAQPPQ